MTGVVAVVVLGLLHLNVGGSSVAGRGWRGVGGGGGVIRSLAGGVAQVAGVGVKGCSLPLFCDFAGVTKDQGREQEGGDEHLKLVLS